MCLKKWERPPRVKNILGSTGKDETHTPNNIQEEMGAAT